MQFIDLFSGVGGFTRGLELAGHECIGHCELDKFAEASYRSMHTITEEQRKYLLSLPLNQRQKEILKEEYLNGERSKKMIKTDKVVYRTRTLTEYDWLMDRLDEAGCAWEDGSSPIDDNYDCYEDKKNWDLSISDSHIWVKNKTISFSYPEFFYENYKDSQDYEIMEVSDLMKRAIKTDKVIYRVRTQEEYDWLMKELEEDECKWVYGELPTKFNDWGEYSTETCIRLKDKIMDYADFDFYKNESAYQDYEFIEVSDLMENEMKTDILDKLETMNEHLNNKFENLEKENDESQKIKKVVYTTEVYFE